MTIHLQLVPIISLIAGIAILAQPRLLNYIVAIYLIVIGVIGIVISGWLGAELVYRERVGVEETPRRDERYRRVA